MKDNEPFLSDEEILERMPFFESTDTDPGKRAWHAEALVDYCRGPVAEKAVRVLVEGFPPETLESLVDKHVVGWATPPGQRGYCGNEPHVVAGRLVDRGFSPVRTTTEGYCVGWPGGGELVGEDLCRIALLAVWLRRIQETDPKPSGPSY